MSLRVLVVDDEKEMAELIQGLIELSGVGPVAIAHTAEAAAAYIKDHQPELVFMDIELGGKVTGIDILQQFVQLAPKVRICMASAYRDEYEARSLRLGAYDFLRKPFSVEDIRRVIARAQSDRSV